MKNMSDNFTKHHPIWHHRTLRPRYLKPTKNTYKNRNNGELEPDEGVLEQAIPGNQETE